MAGVLRHICRHPIKSLGWEEVSSVTLSPDQTLPFDRHWALAHEAAGFDPDAPTWRSKRDFVRGVASAPLMAIRAKLSEDAKTLSLTHPDRPPLELQPDREECSTALVDWVAPLWPDTRPAAHRLVSAGATQALTDVEPPYISLLSLNSLRDLSENMGQDLSMHRWRGNLWFDGIAPWEEFDWLGREIAVGPVRLRVEDRITRCMATEANPETGKFDAKTLDSLEKFYGHQDFGIYARVVAGGPLRTGDPLVVS
ncbi:MAG: MOSC domain-containing protein [Pseudomonadota bacterium]